MGAPTAEYQELRRQRGRSSSSLRRREGTEDHLPAPEEQLTRKDPQMWALWLGLAALLMAGWATRSPLSCARPVELDFNRCDSIVGDASGLELPAFCRTGCMRKHSLLLLCTIGVGVLGQCVVVVLNYGEFNNLFRLSWYFDLHDVLPKAEAVVDDVEAAVDDALVSGGSGLWGRALRFVRRPLEAKLDKKAVMLLQAGEKVTKRSVQQVTSAKSASSLSVCAFLLSIFMLGRVLLFGFSTAPVTFRCEPDVQKVLQAEIAFPILVGMLASMLLLSLAVFLEATASWAVHIKVHPVDSDDLRARSSSDSTLGARATSGSGNGTGTGSGSGSSPGTGHDGGVGSGSGNGNSNGHGTGAAGKGKRLASQRLRDHFKEYYQRDGKNIFVPLLKEGFPAPDLLLLKCVPGKKLAGMRYNGVLYAADCLQWALEGGRVPKKSGEEVVLLFKSRRSKSLKEKFRKAWGRNPHRAFAMMVLIPGCLLLFQASESCWACMDAINISRKITVLELQSRLLLMSACGRHASIGNASMLGGVALALAVISQAFILSRSRESVSSVSRHHEDQLIFPLLDFRQHGDLSITEYEDEDEEQEEQPDDIFEEEDKEVDVMCYVWARPHCKQEVEQETKASTDAKHSHKHGKQEEEEAKDSHKHGKQEEEEEVLNCRHNRGKLPTPPPEEPEEAQATAEGGQGQVHGQERGEGDGQGQAAAASAASAAAATASGAAPPPRAGGKMQYPWQQSRRARKVRLLKVGYERRETMLQSIPETGQYSRASIAIEILNKDGTRQALPSKDDPHAGFQQIVPAEFIAGSFHASVNLGPFEAWEKVSAALAFVAALLAGVDLAFFVFLDGGGVLSSCMDVLTKTSCIYFDVDVTEHKGAYLDKGEDFEFRASAGPGMAFAGGFLSLLGVLALRVANDRDRRDRCCASSYCYAFFYSLQILWRFLVWAIMSVPGFFKNCRAYWEPRFGC